MKIGTEQSLPKAGSMGIPADMLEAGNRARENQAKRAGKKAASKSKSKKEEPSEEVEHGFLSEAPQSDEASLKENLEMTERLKPTEILKKLGIEFTSDNLHELLFKGTFEAKGIDLVKGHFKASIRTLRSGEYNEIEELMEEALDSNPNMTRNHYEMTQSAYIVAYAVTELDGKSPVRVVKGKDGKADSKATARAKHKVLMALSTTLFNKLVTTHSVIKTCVDLIAEDPDLLKNS